MDGGLQPGFSVAHLERVAVTPARLRDGRATAWEEGQVCAGVAAAIQARLGPSPSLVRGWSRGGTMEGDDLGAEDRSGSCLGWGGGGVRVGSYRRGGEDAPAAQAASTDSPACP